VIILISLVFVYALDRHWKTDPEAVCNIAGGFWGGVHGCDNYCSKEGRECPDKIIFGCECGLDKCWTGSQCVPRTEK
jgi:hypothetical protein